MSDDKAVKAKVIELTNAYYARKGLKKTVSESDWSKITEPCSEGDAEEAAIDICSYYKIAPPADVKELVLEGLNAVASYISSASDAGLGSAKMLDR